MQPGRRAENIVTPICHRKMNLFVMLSSSHIFVAIGANLPGFGGIDARRTVSSAVEALRALPGLRFAGLSRWYATAPIPIGGPDYVNGVAWLEGCVDPVWLLHRLQAIEERAGRVRTTANAPRTLDLDIVAMGQLVRDAPDPVLPHPRAHERAFVLAPLVDLMPGWVHPRLHKSCAALLKALPPQEIRLL